MSHPRQRTDNGTPVAQAQAYPDPCVLADFVGFNTLGSLAYVQLHDSDSALVGLEVPVFSIPVPGGNTPFSFSIDLAFDRGLTVAISTSRATFVSAGAYLSYAITVRS